VRCGVVDKQSVVLPRLDALRDGDGFVFGVCREAFSLAVHLEARRVRIVGAPCDRFQSGANELFAVRAGNLVLGVLKKFGQVIAALDRDLRTRPVSMVAM
jgi:hypothetical protein